MIAKRMFLFISSVAMALITLAAPVHPKEFYQISLYLLKSNDQIAATDQYLKDAYLPALHRAGIKKIGVFKPISNDTSAVKKIYVLIPFKSLAEWQKLPQVLEKDGVYKTASAGFLNAPATSTPFDRMEMTLLEAFEKHPSLTLPVLKGDVKDKIYELRSYESPTEALHVKKVSMFNAGEETKIFDRLGFNPIFYSNVLAGCKMPNLVYMISFENIAERDAHWKTFGNDPEWKRISGLPEFENKVSVSHIDSILMHCTDYSDI